MTKYVPHRFGPNETLSGILKKYNSHAATAEQIAMLMVQYNELNGKHVPRVGETRLIPIDLLPEQDKERD